MTSFIRLGERGAESFCGVCRGQPYMYKRGGYAERWVLAHKGTRSLRHIAQTCQTRHWIGKVCPGRFVSDIGSEYCGSETGSEYYGSEIGSGCYGSEIGSDIGPGLLSDGAGTFEPLPVSTQLAVLLALRRLIH
jgi:hypothetical protein